MMPAEIAREISGFLGPYLERGDLGEKTGKEFYTYPNPVYLQSDFLLTDD